MFFLCFSTTRARGSPYRITHGVRIQPFSLGCVQQTSKFCVVLAHTKKRQIKKPELIYSSPDITSAISFSCPSKTSSRHAPPVAVGLKMPVIRTTRAAREKRQNLVFTARPRKNDTRAETARWAAEARRGHDERFRFISQCPARRVACALPVAFCWPALALARLVRRRQGSYKQSQITFGVSSSETALTAAYERARRFRESSFAVVWSLSKAKRVAETSPSFPWIHKYKYSDVTRSPCLCLCHKKSIEANSTPHSAY